VSVRSCKKKKSERAREQENHTVQVKKVPFEKIDNKKCAFHFFCALLLCKSLWFRFRDVSCFCCYFFCTRKRICCCICIWSVDFHLICIGNLLASERDRASGGWGGKGEGGAHVHVPDFHTLIYTLTHTHFYKLTFSKLRLHLLWIKIWFCLYFCLCYCLFFLPLPLNFAHRKNIDCTHTHTRTHFL